MTGRMVVVVVVVVVVIVVIWRVIMDDIFR